MTKERSIAGSPGDWSSHNAGGFLLPRDWWSRKVGQCSSSVIGRGSEREKERGDFGAIIAALNTKHHCGHCQPVTLMCTSVGE
ncbi:hypothetical protein O3P69_009205 [Scylla paramamosain]|uniref:Uncharacterized protein n=1 Tax=Scylla paramamosain TaxID=85552 RepID=A0AAW0T9L4_SCYPA